MKGIFFDLDYTLYDQRQYLCGALRDVASLIAARCGRKHSVLNQSLREHWECEGTDGRLLFDEWLSAEGLYGPLHVKLCVEAFHAYAPPRMELYPGAAHLLSEIRGRYRTGIITDGHAGMQKNKLMALRVEEQVERVFLPYVHGMRKPDPRIFLQVLKEEDLEPSDMLYVGDHPIKDIMAADQAGLCTVRVLTGEFATLPDHPDHPPTYRAANLWEVQALVKEFSRELSADKLKARPNANWKTDRSRDRRPS